MRRRLLAASHPDRAAQLFVIAEHMNPSMVNLLYLVERNGREAAMAQVKQALEDEQMAAGWTEGNIMPSIRWFYTHFMGWKYDG